MDGFFGDIKDSTLKGFSTFGEEKSNNHLLAIHEMGKNGMILHIDGLDFFEPWTGKTSIFRCCYIAKFPFATQRMDVLIIVLRLVQGGLFYQLQLGLELLWPFF